VKATKNNLKEIRKKLQNSRFIYRADKEDPPISTCLKIIDFNHRKSFSILVENINWYGYRNKESWFHIVEKFSEIFYWNLKRKIKNFGMIIIMIRTKDMINESLREIMNGCIIKKLLIIVKKWRIEVGC
jgi:hypothetical protein